jgi:hypothetical protein
MAGRKIELEPDPVRERQSQLLSRKILRHDPEYVQRRYSGGHASKQRNRAEQRNRKAQTQALAQAHRERG